MIACQRGNAYCTNLLLQAKAEVNLQDHKGRTALMIACAKGCYDIVKQLLIGGADIDLKDNTGKSAWTMSTTKEISTLLVQYHPRAVVLSSKLIDENSLELSGESDETSTEEVLNGSNIADQCALIAASEVGDEDRIELLLSEGAQINSKDSKGRTALISASGNGRATATNLLLEKGAHIDSQDDEGYSALMTACQNGHVQSTSHLLDADADTLLKNSEGKTAFDLAIGNSNAELLPLFTKLRSKPSYPGILFLEGTKRETVTTKKKIIDLEEVGISLSIPEDALPSTDPPLQLKIQPCFSGSFDVPEDIELVSPAYIVHPSRKVAFQKKVLVKIWHHVNLETEEDCEDMVFLSASISPEYRGGSPAYTFREIRGAKGSFRPGEEQPVGKIALKHFCTLVVGKKRRREEDKPENELQPKRSKG